MVEQLCPRRFLNTYYSEYFWNISPLEVRMEWNTPIVMYLYTILFSVNSSKLIFKNLFEYIPNIAT